MLRPTLDQFFCTVIVSRWAEKFWIRNNAGCIQIDMLWTMRLTKMADHSWDINCVFKIAAIIFSVWHLGQHVNLNTACVQCVCIRDSRKTNAPFYCSFQNFYPINYLRNVGLNNTRTQWIFLMDIDFVPSKEVYTAALEFLSDRNAEMEKKVFMCHRRLLKISIPSMNRNNFQYDQLI